MGVTPGGFSRERKGGGAVPGSRPAAVGAPDALYLYGGVEFDQGLQSLMLDSVAWIDGESEDCGGLNVATVLQFFVSLRLAFANRTVLIPASWLYDVQVVPARHAQIVSCGRNFEEATVHLDNQTLAAEPFSETLHP